ncbi:glyoxalase family protein [Penicillium atrosanguineum]|nr:glyoxalase family protein [Penicillium atrosanguineum]
MIGQGKIRLARLAYVHYEHQDLEKFKQFAGDFGLIEAQSTNDVVYYRGYGQDPFAYIDYDNACALPGATIRNASERPGGGHLVVVKDPNGYEMEVCWGQTENSVASCPLSSAIGEPAPMNGSFDKPRKGQFMRFAHGPAMVHKLGHFGYMTDNYEETCAWYSELFNFIPTDILLSPEDKSLEVATFFRLDVGKEYVDHHCLLLTRETGGGTKIHHSSFEVEDIDTQILGHYWLGDQGYKSLWGVEHYADGDVVNDELPVDYAVAGNMAVWGPEPPKEFTAKASA